MELIPVECVIKKRWVYVIFYLAKLAAVAEQPSSRAEYSSRVQVVQRTHRSQSYRSLQVAV